jgi:hypothetical protein
MGGEIATLALTPLLLRFGGPRATGAGAAVLLPCFVAAVFCFGTATDDDIQAARITWLFAGFLGGVPVANRGGMLVDV